MGFATLARGLSLSAFALALAQLAYRDGRMPRSAPPPRAAASATAFAYQRNTLQVASAAAAAVPTPLAPTPYHATAPGGQAPIPSADSSPPPPGRPPKKSASVTGAATTAALSGSALTSRRDNDERSKAVANALAEQPVHVVVGADREHWPGVIGVINSLVSNSATPQRLRILALAPAGLERAFTRYLRCQGLAPADSADAPLRVSGFSASRPPPLRVLTKLTNLESPLNFARFYLSELLPAGARKALYLDADVIVKGDAVALFDAALPRGELCAATLRKTTLGDKGVASLRGQKLQARFEARYGAALPLREHGFNAGVFLFNLARWQALNLTAEVEYWIRANNAEKLYSLGSQPPLTLAVHGARTGGCQPLPAEWHLDCLGCIGAGRIKTAEELRRAKLYHWNGPRKPFKTGHGGNKRAHTELFEPYQGRGDACQPL